MKYLVVYSVQVGRFAVNMGARRGERYVKREKDTPLSVFVDEYLLEKGWTPQFVADRGNVGLPTDAKNRLTTGYVYRIRMGIIVEPAANKVELLARGLGVSKDFLLSKIQGSDVAPADFKDKLLSLANGSEYWSDDEKANALALIDMALRPFRDKK